MNSNESSICDDLLKQIQDTNGDERYRAIQEYKLFLDAVRSRVSISASPDGRNEPTAAATIGVVEESELDKFVRDCRFSGQGPDTLTDAERRLKEALSDLTGAAVDLAVGKVLLILRDEGILKAD